MINPNDRKSIFFIIPSLDKGGAEKVSINLAKGISKHNFSTNIIYLNSKLKENEIRKNFDLSFFNIKSNKFRYSILKIYKILKKNNPDYIFSSLAHVNIFLLILKLFNLITCKIIIRESNLPIIQVKHSQISKLLNFSYKYLYRFSDVIICSSPLMIKQFNENFKIDLNKLFLLHNPVDVNSIKKLSSPSKENDSRFTHFVSIGRLEYQKAFDELINIFSKIKINYKLFIIGEGKEKDKLQELINKKNLNNKIYLLGFQENPYKILASSDVLISLSRWEGMPNSILEMLVLGKKVIFFDRFKIFASFKDLNFNNLFIANNYLEIKKIINKSSYKYNNSTYQNNLPKNFFINNVIDEFIKILKKL